MASKVAIPAANFWQTRSGSSSTLRAQVTIRSGFSLPKFIKSRGQRHPIDQRGKASVS